MKKNIAIVVGRIAGSGPARVASNLSINLSKKLYNVVVIVYYEEKNSYPIDGDFISLNTAPSKNPIKKLWNTIKRIYKLKKIKKKYNISTTISLLPNPNLVNILSRSDDKVIVSERSYMSKELTGIHKHIYKLVYKFIYRKADEIIAVSNVVKQDLINKFKVKKDNLNVIYNFYDVERIKDLSNELLEEKYKELYQYPVIITAGRLSSQKGQWHLIRSFKQVKLNIPNAKLLILGEGELYKYLKELTQELGIEEDVHFLGFQDNPFKFIAKADIYAFPSLYEGFPNALAEAMVCGLPVISTDCPSGPRELLEPSMQINQPTVSKITYGEYGILVPTSDGKKYNGNHNITHEELLMAQGILNLLSNEELITKYKQKAQIRMNNFKKDTIISEWESYLK